MTTRKENKQNQSTNWKGDVIPLKPNELQMLDELVRDFVAGKFPPAIDTKGQTYDVDIDYLRIKIRKLMAISGSAGLATRIFLAGLRSSEVKYIHRQEICPIQSYDCHKLHVVDMANDLIVVIVNWIREYRSYYFAILPTRLWQCFRNLVSLDSSDITNASNLAQSAHIDFE